MQIISSAFSNNEMIPSRYTCDGKNISPPLVFSGIPRGSKTLVLICDDPDAPAGTWVHWVMYNIPANTSALPEGISAKEKLSDGSRQGLNDFRNIGYGGPCPPGGTHRYFFKLYALQDSLKNIPKATKAEIERAMEEHVIASCQLIGKYKRQ